MSSNSTRSKKYKVSNKATQHGESSYLQTVQSRADDLGISRLARKAKRCEVLVRVDDFVLFVWGRHGGIGPNCSIGMRDVALLVDLLFMM
jgi:hypothetical protein